MDWKLVLQLSMFGLFMGVATVFFIPSKIEPACWLVIFLVCAYIIAKRRSSKHFLHGLCVSLVNSAWITAAHVLLFNQYAARHVQEIDMMKSAPVAPRLLMILVGPMFGVISGLILGLFALIAGKLVKPASPDRPGVYAAGSGI